MGVGKGGAWRKGDEREGERLGGRELTTKDVAHHQVLALILPLPTSADKVRPTYADEMRARTR